MSSETSEIERLKKELHIVREERDELFKEVLDLRKDKSRLNLIEASCWDLRAVDEPHPGGDDGEVAWVIIEHHMAAPKERELSREYSARAAIDYALNPRPEPEEVFDELDADDGEEFSIDPNWNGSLDVRPSALR